MFEGMIFFKEKDLKEVEDIFDVIIPNDYLVFPESYELRKPDPWSNEKYYCMEVKLENSKEWNKLKKTYFDGKFRKRSLPGCIHID